jgi:tRNA(fMet)-specific endonuclease VapC
VTYLLDTNVVVALLKDRPHGVRERLRQASATDASIAVSSIVLYELWYGVARRGRWRENAERLRVFLSGRLELLAFESEDAAAAGELRASLEAAGTTIGPYDLLIAGQALRHGATLVTANVAEFARAPGLRWEDWTVVA